MVQSRKQPSAEAGNGRRNIEVNPRTRKPSLTAGRLTAMALSLLMLGVFTLVRAEITDTMCPPIGLSSQPLSTKKPLLRHCSSDVEAADPHEGKKELAAAEAPTSSAATKSGEPLQMVDIVLAGAIATVAGDVAMHPVDTIKTIQQASGMSLGAAIKSISKGPNPIGAFYEGVVPYCVADGLSGAVKFATYEKTKAWCEDNVAEEMVPAARFVCAAVAFVACSVILVPGELLKQRLQAGVYTGLGSGIKTLLTHEGPRAMFTGYGATLFRDVPYTMLELGLYDLLKSFAQSTRRRITGQEAPSSQSDELVAAAVTGGIVGFVTNPLDVVKTRMMTASKGSLAGPIAAGRILIRDSGVQGLLAGSTARVMWLAPFTTIYLGCYELAKRCLLNARGNLASDDSAFSSAC